MENNRILCHIVGLSPLQKNKLKNDYKYKKYHFIDLDELNQEIFDNIELKKMFKQYQYFKNNKNEKYKEIDKKMSNFWEKNLINLIENNFLPKKKTIIIGNNSHFRNLSKKIQIPTNNRFFIEFIKDDIKLIIKHNLEKNKKNIINGTYPLNNIDYEYLLKTKSKLQESFKNNGYIIKNFIDIEKILELLLQRDDSIEGLWISLNEPYNVSTRIHPKKNDKLFAYTEPVHALLGSFSWNSNEVEKISKGKDIKLIEKKNNALDLLKVKRFLYMVDPDTFIPHEKGNNIKYFSQVPTMIMDKEKISNVYKKLKDVGILNN
tara:strand:- start:371 stop:1327 length:957 start_codon:yes stop_codon:yes gene_type:complete